MTIRKRQLVFNSLNITQLKIRQMRSQSTTMVEHTIKDMLHTCYSQVKDNAQLKNYVCNTPVEWMVYYENPFYLTDGETCIMFEFILPSAPQDLNKISSYNTIRTNYYNTFKGCYKVFDCTEAVLEETDTNDQYPLPYSPYYHFKQRFEEFRAERGLKSKQTTQCRIVRIESWKLNIVNIANSGFLAPVISILTYSMKSSVRMKDTDVTSILYDPATRKRMLSYYHQLLRQHKHTVSSNLNSKLCVFVANSKHPSNFLNVDIKSNLLMGPAVRIPTKEKLILLSNSAPIQGEFYLKQPLGHIAKSLPRIPVYSQQSRNKLNEDFFAQLADRCSSSASDDEDDPLRGYHEPGMMKQQAINSEEESDDEQEDNVLRKLYKKMLEKDKINYRIQQQSQMDVEALAGETVGKVQQEDSNRMKK